MATPIKALELHYSVIQFLIIIIYKAVVYFGGKGSSLLCCNNCTTDSLSVTNKRG